MRDGDLLSLDCGAFYRGYHGDSATTVPIGPIRPEAQRLLTTAWQALDVGIAMARPGVRLGDLGAAIQDVIERAGYGVVRDLCGHGIGRQMHEDPQVPNFGERGHGLKLAPGMVIAIEPMLTAGDYETITLDDDWTIISADHSLSAHVEHTVAITEHGPEILTLR